MKKNYDILETFSQVESHFKEFCADSDILFPVGCPIKFKKQYANVDRKICIEKGVCATIVASHGTYYALKLSDGKYVEGIHGTFLKENL